MSDDDHVEVHEMDAIGLYVRVNELWVDARMGVVDKEGFRVLAGAVLFLLGREQDRDRAGEGP